MRFETDMDDLQSFELAKYPVGVVGATGVPKAKLMLKLMGASQWNDMSKPFQTEIVVDDRSCSIEVYGTLDGHRSFLDQCLKHQQGYLIVYETSSMQSFLEVDELYNKLLRLKNERRVPVVLVAIKNSEKEEQIPSTDGEDKARSLGCVFNQVNLQSGDGIAESFENLVRAIRTRNQFIALAQRKQRKTILSRFASFYHGGQHLDRFNPAIAHNSSDF